MQVVGANKEVACPGDVHLEFFLESTISSIVPMTIKEPCLQI